MGAAESKCSGLKQEECEDGNKNPCEAKIAGGKLVADGSMCTWAKGEGGEKSCQPNFSCMGKLQGMYNYEGGNGDLTQTDLMIIFTSIFMALLVMFLMGGRQGYMC